MEKPIVLLYEYGWEDSGIYEFPNLTGKVISHTSIKDGAKVMVPYVTIDFDGYWCSTRHRYLLFKTYEEAMSHIKV